MYGWMLKVQLKGLKIQLSIVYFTRPTYGWISIKMTSKNYQIIFVYIFRISCVLFFCIEAYLCLHSYLYSNLTTRTLKLKQEERILPEICITSMGISPEFQKLHNLSKAEYIDGKWKIEGFTEEELYKSISVKLHELIMVGKLHLGTTMTNLVLNFNL